MRFNLLGLPPTSGLARALGEAETAAQEPALHEDAACSPVAACSRPLGVLARLAYERGREAERLATADFLREYAEHVGDVVALSWLDGLRDGGLEVDGYSELVADHSQRLREYVAQTFRREICAWQLETLRRTLQR